MPGRPTKLTKKVHEAIVESVRSGNYIEVAVRAAGISKQTFYNWKARAEEHADPGVYESGKNKGKPKPIPAAERPYVDFLDALTRAEAEAEAKAVKILGDAFTEDWRAAVEFLKRKAPDRWSATERHEHSGSVDHQVQVEDLRGLNDEELREYRRLRAKTSQR